MTGYSPVIQEVPHAPPGPWTVPPGVSESHTALEEDGCAIYTQVIGSAQVEYRYAQLYVYVTDPSGSDPNWQPWKKVDVDWPKIDSRTGQPFDQFLEWYSPLAE